MLILLNLNWDHRGKCISPAVQTVKITLHLRQQMGCSSTYGLILITIKSHKIQKYPKNFPSKHIGLVKSKKNTKLCSKTLFLLLLPWPLEGSWIEIHCFSSFHSTFLNVIIDIYFEETVKICFLGPQCLGPGLTRYANKEDTKINKDDNNVNIFPSREKAEYQLASLNRL